MLTTADINTYFSIMMQSLSLKVSMVWMSDSHRRTGNRPLRTSSKGSLISRCIHGTGSIKFHVNGGDREREREIMNGQKRGCELMRVES